MNTYKCSDGTRVTQDQINRYMRKAKKEMIEAQKLIFGYNFCETCERNDCKPLDCSHTISVDKAKKMGRTELCWGAFSMILEGRCCHKKRDGLNLQFNGN